MATHRGYGVAWTRHVAGLTGGLLLAAIGHAAPIVYDTGPLTFQTSGQSMWGEGNALILDESVFLGAVWSENATFGSGFTGGEITTSIPVPHVHLPSGWECHGFLCSEGHFHDPGGIHIHNIDGPTIDTTTGIEGNISTEGRAGLNFNVRLDSGSVDAQVEFAAEAIIPEAGTYGLGDLINLNPTSMLQDGQFSTNLAEASARMEAVLGVRASLSGTACLVGGCVEPNVNIGFADQVLELASFNENGDGAISILGGSPELFNFGDPINIPSAVPGGSLGDITVELPDIDTVSSRVGDRLVAAGEDDFIGVKADLDGLLLAPAGLPGLGVTVDAGIFSLSGDLVDVNFGPVLKVVQNFEFEPTLWVELAFDKAVQLADSTIATSIVSPWASLPSFGLLSDLTRVTPTFFLNGLFTNQTSLGIDGEFDLSVLQASLSAAISGISWDLGGIGPLFSVVERSNLFNLPPLFSSSYALGGFNRLVGESFVLGLSDAVVGVPEPGTLTLLALGLLGLAALRTRRAAGERR